MRNCSKRQKVVDRGTGIVVFRCLNKRCNMHRKNVDESVCDNCPVAVSKHSRPCLKRTVHEAAENRNSVTAEELVNVTDEEVMTMIKDAGMEIKGLDDQPLKIEEDGTVPQYPPMSMQLWAYKEALLRWNKAGRPVRSKEEVEMIHETHCKNCDWYDSEKKRCKGCGCRVTVGELAVLNKIKMKTEHCPKELW